MADENNIETLILHQQKTKEDEERRVAKGVNRLVPNPTGQGIRDLLGGEPPGKVSMEETEAAILATMDPLVEGAKPGKSTKGNV